MMKARLYSPMTKEGLMQRSFWFIVSALSFFIETDPAYGMSHSEAISRCQSRFDHLKNQEGRLNDGPYKVVFAQGLSDVYKHISQLKGTHAPAEMYRLSSECHKAMQALEWLVNSYGKPEPAKKPEVVESLHQAEELKVPLGTAVHVPAKPHKKASPRAASRVKKISTAPKSAAKKVKLKKA